MLAADVAQLQRLGKGSWMAMPSRPGSKEAAGGQRSARAGSRAAVGRTPSASGPQPSASLGPSASGDVATTGQQQQQQQQQQTTGEDRMNGLPDWASCPLLLMHSALRQAAARVALYNLLLPQARELAGGAWGPGGGTKVERPEGGGGIRCVVMLAWVGATAASLSSCG